MVSAGDSLIALLGLPVEDPRVQAALAENARSMQPELPEDDEEVTVDWVTINEIGLEFGFEDTAFVRALPLDKRRRSGLLLSQVYFYNDTPKTQPFPGALPFGLTLEDDRNAVRRKLSAFEATRRSYRRDFWRMPAFDVTVAYVKESGKVESVFCHLPYAPWPSPPGEAERVAPFTVEFFMSLFGVRWSNPDLRARLAPLGYEAALPEVRSEHVADLRLAHGLELTFVAAAKIPNTDKRYPRSLAFGEVTYHSSRDVDARQWAGALPSGLTFDDSQADLITKLGNPAERNDDILEGVAVWHLPNYTLSVIYSNVENRVLRISLYAAGFWERAS